MCQYGGTRPADILRHANPRAVHLGLAALPSQLLDNLNKLIHTSRADWMSAGF
jgi:hypothetical protein